MNFCNQCGAKVTQKIPDNDNRLRYVCSSCEFIHYQNPNIIAGILPIVLDEEGVEKVLLCKRAIEPRYGYWTLPAGFMENEETLEEAAIRESVEEANIKVETLKLYMVMSLPYISQVYMMYVARAENDFSPGIESLETALFSESDIPWDQLAFPVVKTTLEKYFSDRENLNTINTAQKDTPLTVAQFNTLPIHNLIYNKD